MATTSQDVLFVNFNQDASSLAIGTHKYYRLYTIKNAEDIEKIHEAPVEDVCLIERLFSSSLLTMVSLNAPRKLRVCHFLKDNEICQHSYANTILAVKLNRFRVVVCLEESLFIHNIRDMKVLHTIRDTPPNAHGICDLTAAECSYLAYPGSSTMGEVQIFDAANLQAVSMIPAHDGPLAALRFAADGTKIATASEKGTVIRVFSVPTGDKLFEFRRGVKRCVHINSLAFSADAMFLSASSNTETVHIFKLDPQHQHKHDPSDMTGNRSDEEQSTAQSPGWMDYMQKTASAYLPAHMTDILQQDRAFATAKLPAVATEKRTMDAITTFRVNKTLRLMVACTDGYLYIYNVDKTTGGECSLMKQHRLFASPPSTGAIVSATSATNTASETSSAAPTSGGSSSYAAACQGAGGISTAAAVHDVTSAADRLRLNDRNEFPPMSHKADD